MTRVTLAVIAVKLGIAACAATVIATLIHGAASRPSRGGEDYQHFASMMQALAFVVWVSIASSLLAFSLMTLRLTFWRVLGRSDVLWMALGLMTPVLILLLALFQTP